MLDHIPDTTFWPLFLLVVLLVTAIAGICLGALFRWVDTPSNKYVSRDYHTDLRCRIRRNGFKTRAGIR
jgi:hypothetical protein